MNEWGNNPATIQAIADVVTAFSVVLVWLSFRETKSSRRVMEGEIASRQRPWLGLVRLAFEAAPKGSADGKDRVRVDAKNNGTMPAENARLELNFELLKRGEPPNPIHWTDSGAKTFLPDEPGKYHVPIASYPQFVCWKDRRQDIAVDGSFKYSLGQTKYETKINAVIYFSANGEIGVRWSHVTVSSNPFVPNALADVTGALKP